MSILISNEIISAITNELNNAESSVQIITAYCKCSSFEHLNGCINPSVEKKRLLVRFRKDDLIKGSTDFEVLTSALNAGWDIYIRFDLHAKTYIVDNKRGLIGSANTTNSGLSIGRAGNMEMATLVDLEPKDVEKINRLFDDAILVDDALLVEMQKQLSYSDNMHSETVDKWDLNITGLFSPHIETLFSHELPDSFELKENEYFAFLDETYSSNNDSLKTAFRWSNAYLWLLDQLKANDGCLYFGELSAKLHDALITDPKPYRKDVKQMLANLLKLIELLEMREVIVDRPNYSQRVRLASTVDNG